MFKILLALHLIAAIFLIGPLVHAVTTSARGLRQGDAAAIASSARTATVYSYASVLVVIFGFGLMSAEAPWVEGENVAGFDETWIWLSTLLWLLGVALTLAMVVPALQQAGARLTAGEAVDGLRARVAAGGGVVGLVFLAIVLLMVYKPGS